MIRGFVEWIGNVGPTRMDALVREGVVESYYVMLGPDREAGVYNVAHWKDCTAPKWGWFVNTADQEKDVAGISWLDAQVHPVGWCLNIEKVLEGANLKTLIEGVAALGKPIVASLAAITASHVEFDYRTLDKHGVVVDWQAYFDSGEGSTPQIATEELYSSSFVVPGREYRHRLGAAYGWGKVTRIEQGQRATFDSYKSPADCHFNVTAREWGHTVVSRNLYRDGKNVGMLMGKAAYPRIRMTLDVTRTAQARPAAEWTPIAASAKAPGASKRPISVYLAEHASDAVMRAIAAGAP